MTPSFLSLLPPILAVALAIGAKQVTLSLCAGILSGWIIIAGGDPFSGFAQSLNAVVNVFRDGGNTQVILFCGLVGSLTELMRANGGFAGFIQTASRSRRLHSPKALQTAAALTGLGIFVETTLSSLLTGAVFRPLFEQKRLSRQKLAYICDSTSAPVNLLFPLNAWGAFITGLLAGQNIPNPAGVLLAVLPINFYAILTIVILFTVIWTGKDFGAMKSAEKAAANLPAPHPPDRCNVSPHGSAPSDKSGASGSYSASVPPDLPDAPGAPPRLSHMIPPIVALAVSTPIGLLITGRGDITAGSGSTAVLWAVCLAIFAAAVPALIRKSLTLKQAMTAIEKGAADMTPVMLLMLLAFALGDTAKALQTGAYAAQLAGQLTHPALIPAGLFILAALLSFATGTSWGSYAILIPIAVPLAQHTGIYLPLAVSAVLSGGLFGDHASPVSDTTIVSSMASQCSLIEHTRTQLPYALTAAAGTALLFLAAGFFFQ